MLLLQCKRIKSVHYLLWSFSERSRYCYIIECAGVAIMIACKLTYQGTHLHTYWVLLWQCEFAIKSSVQACSQKSTRDIYWAVAKRTYAACTLPARVVARMATALAQPPSSAVGPDDAQQ